MPPSHPLSLAPETPRAPEANERESGEGRTEERTRRLRTTVIAHHGLVWRSLRRFGVPEVRVDDAVSHVFDVLMRKLDGVVVGKEQAFLVQVCAHVASELRRADARRARVEERAERASEPPSPEEIVQQRQARAMLDEVLEEIDEDARTVFVLHELEQWTAAKIAESLEIPAGTVASRLRRGREQFERGALKARRRLERGEGQP